MGTLSGKGLHMTDDRCADHPAYDADYCPLCGTARVIGEAR